MQVIKLKKLGCNIQLSLFESSTGTYSNYQIDSANFELIFNGESNKVSFTIEGIDSFTTFDITANDVFYINSTGSDVLIKTEASLITNYSLLFAC